MPNNLSVIDLTEFLSINLCKVLVDAGLKAKQNKSEFIDKDYLLYSILINDKQVTTVLNNSAQLKLIYNDLVEKLKNKPKWKKKPERINLDQDVRKVLIESLVEANILNEPSISSLAVFLAFSRLGLVNIDYQDLIKSINITTGTEIKFEEKKSTSIIEDITSLDPDILNQYINHDTYIDQITRILFKDQKKNILLVGNDGIGKESTKYILAQKAIESNSTLSNSKVFSLNIEKIDYSNLPDTLNKINEDINSIPGINKFIIYINNLEINNNESYQEGNLINTLTGSILHSTAWGVIPINYTKYQTLLKSYQTIINNSEIIFFEEPSIETVLNILKTKYKDQGIDDASIQDAISLSQRFIHDKFLPENVISIIDDTLAQAKIDKKNTINTNDIKSIIAQKTGIPMTDITEKEAQDLQNLEETLKSSVIGQDEAVAAVAKTIKRSRAGLRDPKRPIGSFLFLGPSGVGKTQLAKALAKIIYKDENAMIRLDMSEYTDAHTVDRLIGAPPGYVGYEEGGQLTNKVLKKPYSLILLDEVEKANPKVFDIFLQVLDDGRLTDGQGKTVDFKNTIIIMTSNLSGEENLNSFFRTEFLNRIDQIIHFKPLNIEVGKNIARIFIKDLQNRLKEKNITINVTDDVINQIATDGISDKFGARPLRRLVEEKIEDPIVEKIISGEVKPGETLTWNKI